MSKPDSRVVTVRIYDREYSLRSSASAERLASLAAALDARMREVAGTSGTVDTLKVAVLVSLGLAEELERTREELARLDEIVSRRSLDCAEMLERI